MEGNIKCLDCTNESRLKLLSDGKLRTEDGCVFHIHKFVLAKGSKYFTALFCGMEKDKEEFFISGVRGETMNAILSFIYTGNVSVKVENMNELMIAADYLLLDDLLSKMATVLKKTISVENCISFYNTAQQIDRHDILRLCYRFVETHFESALLSNDVDFRAMSLDSLKQFLSDENLCVSNEKTVFLAIVKWIMGDKFNRQRFLPDLLTCLKLADVNEELAASILEEDIVVNNPYCQQFLVTKQLFPNADNVEILQNCLRVSSMPSLEDFIHRQPTKLHCIAYYSAYNGRHFVQLYVTYDDNIDLWRKIGEVDFSPKYMTCIDSFIYMLKRDDDRNFRYSITEKQLYELDDFIIPRHNYAVVVVDGKIYALGGISDFTGEEIYDVEIYDPEFEVWHSTKPMIPISAFGAVSLNEYLYVVGYKENPEGSEMVAQVYDAFFGTWNLLPATSVGRSHFALVVYLGNVYVIGGFRDDEYLKDVEMFDPVKNEWETKPSLPHAYYVPRAMVLNDLLIVFDDHAEDRMYKKTTLPVFWNAQKESWEYFEDSSPLKNLHLYSFITLDKRELIANLTAENRNPDTCFQESPFI